jgi:hypothetical protein
MNSKETGWTNSGALPSVETWCAARDATGSRLVFGAGTEKTHTAASSGSGQSFAPGCCLAALLPRSLPCPAPRPHARAAGSRAGRASGAGGQPHRAPRRWQSSPQRRPAAASGARYAQRLWSPRRRAGLLLPPLPLLCSEGLRTHHQPPSPPPWTRRSA